MNEQKYKGENLSIPAPQSPYPTSRLAPAMELVELAREVGYPAGLQHVMTLDLTGKLRRLVRRRRKPGQAKADPTNQFARIGICSRRKIELSETPIEFLDPTDILDAEGEALADALPQGEPGVHVGISWIDDAAGDEVTRGIEDLYPIGDFEFRFDEVD